MQNEEHQRVESSSLWHQHKLIMSFTKGRINCSPGSDDVIRAVVSWIQGWAPWQNSPGNKRSTRPQWVFQVHIQVIVCKWKKLFNSFLRSKHRVSTVVSMWQEPKNKSRNKISDDVIFFFLHASYWEPLVLGEMLICFLSEDCTPFNFCLFSLHRTLAVSLT